MDFSANWLLTEKEGKEEILQEALETKGILPDKNIVLYDANGTDAVAVADYLSTKGYENIYTYDVNEWASDDSKPMVQFPGYELLVPASIVKSLIDGETPETFTEGKTVKMVEGSWGEEKESYANGHLPGAIHINTDSIEPPPAWMLPSQEFTLVDNRTWDEYTGKSSGYSYHDKMGRIPGAVFGYAGKTDSNSLDYFRNIDDTMRNADEIIAMWQEGGIDTQNHLSFMCGSGWRAAEVLFYANVAGLDNVSLYSDGWIGWSNAGLPSETGEPVK